MRDDALNICLVLSTRGITYGGLETMADGLASGLVARGHRVTMIGGRGSRDDAPPDVEAIWVSRPSASSFSVRATRALLRTHALNVQSLGFILNGLRRSSVRRRIAAADLVVTFFEGEAVLLSRWLRRRKPATIYYFSSGLDKRWAHRDRSTMRVAVSRFVADRAARVHRYPSHAVVTPGISAAWLEPHAPAKASARDPTLIYLGRLEPTKRVDWVMRVTAALVEEFPNLSLRIVGDGSLRSSLEGTVRNLALGARVQFAGAPRSDGVLAELRQADVLLFPSRAEEFGIVALEALAAGVCVVATDFPVMREATGGIAEFVPADDLDGWRAAVARLLRDDELRRARSERGREWARRFTWETIAAQFEAVARDAVRRKATSSSD